MSGFRSIDSVRSQAPRRRADDAGTGSVKKIHTCPPRPDRDRSSAAGTPLVVQVARNTAASWRHVCLSKSMATNRHVSSASRG